MTQSILDKFKETFHICDLAERCGMQLDRRESSSLWPKYKDGTNTVLVNKAQNIFKIVNDSSGGGKFKGPLDFFIEFFPGVERDNWANIKAEAAKMLNLPIEERQFKKPAEYRKESKYTSFNEKARGNLKKFHNLSTAPLKEHDYLTKQRLISPTLLKQKRFESCIRIPTGSKTFFKNALFFHRDIEGICAYEKHNISKKGNLSLISKNSRKCLWYSDDVFSKDTKQIFIGEAVIDALSFATLTEKTRPNMALISFGGQFDGNLYTDGVSGELNQESQVINALKKIFNQTSADTVYISNDNDQAGCGYDMFFQEFFEIYFPDKFKLFINKPPHALNDWNDYLFAEDYNNRSNYVALAKRTNNLIIAEGAIGAFRMFESDKVKGATVMCIPPAGHMTSQMSAVAMSFMHVMKNENENSVLTYTSCSDEFKHVQKLEKWRSEFIPELLYNAKKNFSPLEQMLEEGRLPDQTVLKSWPGYRENKLHPHKLAKHTKSIILTCNQEKETRYFNSNCDPVKMIVSVPAERYRKQNKYALNDVKNFISDVLKFSDYEDISIRFSPVVDLENGANLKHCAFVNEALQGFRSEYTKQDGRLENIALKRLDGLEIVKDSPPRGHENILQVLAKKQRIKTDDLDSLTPDLNKMKNPARGVRIHEMSEEPDPAIKPMG